MGIECRIRDIRNGILILFIHLVILGIMGEGKMQVIDDEKNWNYIFNYFGSEKKIKISFFNKNRTFDMIAFYFKITSSIHSWLKILMHIW